MESSGEIVALCIKLITRARYVREHRWPVAAASDVLDGLVTAIADLDGAHLRGRIRRLVDEGQELPTTASVELRPLGEHVASCPTCSACDPIRLWHALTHALLWSDLIEDAADMAGARQQQLDAAESSRTSVLIAELDGLAVGRFGQERPALAPYSLVAVMDRVQQLAGLLTASAVDPHVIDDVAWLWSICLDEEAEKSGTRIWYLEQVARFDGSPLKSRALNVHQRVSAISRERESSSGARAGPSEVAKAVDRTNGEAGS